MPELPEVETVVRGVRPLVVGRTILDALADWPGVARVAGEPATVEAFRQRVVGRRIVAARRRAKLLILDLAEPGEEPLSAAGGGEPVETGKGRLPEADGGEPAENGAGGLAEAGEGGAAEAEGTGDIVQHLVFHLKMTGNLFGGPAEGPAPGEARHVRLRLLLDDGRVLYFRDMRKFGYASAFSPEELAGWEFMRTLGPEPLSTGEAAFAARFRGKSGRIKALLLDQTVIAGVGNIYADESLHRAGVRPDAKAADLDEADLKRLWQALRQALTEAIAAGGSSIRDYRQASGEPGAFQDKFRVYGKKGEPCPACGRALVSAKVAGRTSTYCENCQKG